MFDVSFTELLIIGIVALVVIGPEKLPKVARTAGHLLGRAQRYVSDVKRDIKQEIDAADSLGGFKKEMEEAALSVRQSVDETTRALRNPLEEAQEAMRKAEASINNTVAGLPDSSTPAESGDPANAPAQLGQADAAPSTPAEQPAETTPSAPEQASGAAEVPSPPGQAQTAPAQPQAPGSQTSPQFKPSESAPAASSEVKP